MNSTIETAERWGLSRPLFWIVTAAVGLAFFTEHDPEVSLRENFALEADAMQDRALGGSTLRRGAFVGLALVGVVCLVLPSGRTLRIDDPVVVLTLSLVLWCGVSLSWSIDPGMTIRRFGILACCLVAAVGIGKQFGPRDLMLLVVVVSGTYLVLGIHTELALGTFRPHEGDYRFAGTLHPNTQGMNLAPLCLAMICLAGTAGRFRPLLIVLFCVGLAFLVLTRSRTSFAGLLCALGALWALRASSRQWAAIGLGACWTACVAALVALFVGVDLEARVVSAALLGRVHDVASLTDRTPLWIELMHYVEQRPLTGYGCGAFWTGAHIDAVSSQVGWGVWEAHSAWLETLLHVGLIGFGLLLLAGPFGVARVTALYRTSGDPAWGFLAGLFLFNLMHGLLESAMVSATFATFVAGCGLVQLAFNDLLRQEIEPEVAACH